MEPFAAVVNTYGYVGKEFEELSAVVSQNNRGMNRGRNLIALLSLLGVFANAEKMLLAHAPSKKRSQRDDVIAAIAAKYAAAAAPQEKCQAGNCANQSEDRSESWKLSRLPQADSERRWNMH